MAATRETILLIDDDPAILLSVGDQLRFEGYAVVEAASAEEALAQLETVKPGLIILDISMPGIGGMAFLKQISKETTGTMPYPVLIFTARAELDQFFSQIGVSGFLPKTTDPDTLLREVGHIISRGNEPSRESAATGVYGRRPRLIIAEDDPEECRRMVSFFEHNGYEATGVSNSYAVIDTTVNQSPDVILLKYILPHINGPAIAAMLAAMPSTRSIPVVLYREDGNNTAVPPHANVCAFVTSSEEHALLKAVEKACGR